ncbi:MucB/RseB C-terminal domain-containing protein [Marichromatium bheemlicum]|uniref:Transcriptional regulator n=1 Tax=Marichromatium bheemlicum TaxID=365339 RepID=A0ABX1I8F2_9GAMM|nr:MucB/RseB C-terminal domain-containing protein [Marichromatium bheemlicum]NKN33314.1 transcriptional regulator [Marichromatium bheemlicum]
MNRPASHRSSWAAALCLGALLCLLAPWSVATTQQAPAAGSDTPVGELLERMSEALRALSYEGTLIYLHDNQLETLHLIHRVAAGYTQERLVALSGPVRALSRDSRRVNCTMRDGHGISVQSAGSGAGLIDTNGIDPERLGDHYRIERLGQGRVAGRDTEVIGIIPRDALRYGYRFHIDRETALPLKSDLIDRTEQALEQLMFATVTFHPADGTEPEAAPQGVREAPVTEPPPQWRFEGQPPGFQLVIHHRIPQDDGVVVDHFLFTDRLSAYSIYVEQTPAPGLEGSTNIGAVHAAGRRLAGYQITAVGEVPAATVEAAVAGVRRLVED